MVRRPSMNIKIYRKRCRIRTAISTGADRRTESTGCTFYFTWVKNRFELHHKIHIKDAALVEAVRLSSHYLADRFLPDKAIDLVDEAAAMVKMNIDSHPEAIDQLERSIRQLEIEKVALQQEKENEPAQKRLQSLELELAKEKVSLTDLKNSGRKKKLRLKR